MDISLSSNGLCKGSKNQGKKERGQRAALPCTSPQRKGRERRAIGTKITQAVGAQ